MSRGGGITGRLAIGPSTRPGVAALPKAHQFLLVLAAMLLVDALTPRYPDWPRALISPSLVAPAAPRAPIDVDQPSVPALAGVGGETSPRFASKLAALRAPSAPLLIPDDPRWLRLVTKLERRATGGAEVIRVLHLGDSEIANDDVSSTLRERFAARYGDAGPGFVLALAPWSWYLREGFDTASPDGFAVRSLSHPAAGQGNFGPGGAAFDAKYAGASASVGVDSAGHSSCDVSLLAGRQPEGAPIAVSADGHPLGELATAGSLGVTSRAFHLTPCPHRLTARATTLPARLFGWSVEWGEPGVVWSTLGFVGASAKEMLDYAPDRLGEALAALHPDLVVVAHGLNVAYHDAPPPDEEAAGLKRALAELHRGAPEAACLVMTPYPIASTDSGQPAPSASLGALVEMQRRVALDAGCAFLDRVALEGGGQQAMTWLDAHPRILSGDYIHLTRRGAERVGSDIAQALLASLAEGG